MDRIAWRQELQFLHRNLTHYLTFWPQGEEKWAPTHHSFTLLELASHLYTLPLAYAAVLSANATKQELVQIWGGPWAEKGPDDLKASLDTGMTALLEKLASMSDEEFVTNKLPWPFGEPLTPQAHLYTLATHLYHHRGQFHLYLKQLGQAVSTDSIYWA